MQSRMTATAAPCVLFEPELILMNSKYLHFIILLRGLLSRVYFFFRSDARRVKGKESWTPTLREGLKNLQP